jgi:predicted amidohydrolase
VPSPVVEICGVRSALLICYDVEFPESGARLAGAGAELVLVPTALPESGHAAFIAERIVPVRAFENGIAVVYANHAGSDGRVHLRRALRHRPAGRHRRRPRASAGWRHLIVADYDPGRLSRTAARPIRT